MVYSMSLKVHCHPTATYMEYYRIHFFFYSIIELQHYWSLCDFSVTTYPLKSYTLQAISHLHMIIVVFKGLKVKNQQNSLTFQTLQGKSRSCCSNLCLWEMRKEFKLMRVGCVISLNAFADGNVDSGSLVEA